MSTQEAAGAGRFLIGSCRNEIPNKLRPGRTLTASVGYWVLLLCLLGTGSVQAAFELTVDNIRVELGDSVTATFRFDGDPDGQQPDFSLLEQDFQIESSSTFSQRRIINFETFASTSWVIRLKPKREGTLLIPAIPFRGEENLPVTIRVTGADPEFQARVNNEVFFEETLTPEHPYVQSQLTYVRRLFYGADAQLFGELPGAPNLTDAIVLPLEAPAPNNVQRDGKAFGMIEQRFAIFPQKSGTLTIEPVSIQASITAEPTRSPRRRRSDVTSDRLKINVLPQPADYPKTEPWLPARALQLRESWQPPSDQARVGEPIVRTLQLEAVGISKSVLPELRLREIPEAKSYVDEPTSKETTNGEHITGHKELRITYVPTQPGQMTLPGLELTWFDTVSNSIQRARLAPRNLTVAGDPLPVASADLADAIADDQTQTQRNPTTLAANETDTAIAMPAINANPALVVLLCLALAGWSYTYWEFRQRKHTGATPTPTPPSSSNTKLELRALESACRNNDAGSALRALRQLQMHSAETRSIPPDLLTAMQAACYSATPQSWSGKTLLDWLDANKSPEHKPNERSPLPELYERVP